MKEELITFETAKLAKEKGFNEKCFQHYNFDKYLSRISKSIDVVVGPYEELLLTDNLHYSAPTQSLLQKWLREVHKFHVEVFINDSSINKLEEYTYNISLPRIKEDEVNWKYDLTICNTYEEALETALYQALKLIKTI